MLVPLHVCSHHSLGRGTASVEAICGWARDHGCSAIALTDLENLYGQIRFHHACADAGVRPVTGVELRPGFDGRGALGTRAGRIVLLARDRTGYANLCRIVTRRRVNPASTTPAATGVDPIGTIAGLTDGLIALTDHIPTAEALLRDDLMAVEDVRLLLVRPARHARYEQEVLAGAKRLGIPLVADADATMLRSEDGNFQRLLFALHTGELLARVTGERGAHHRTLESLEHATTLFSDVPQAIDETHAIAEQCRLDLRSAERILPPVAAGEEGADAALARECASRLAAARAGGRLMAPDYDDRLAAELDVIARTGFAAYFLAIAGIVEAARERSILTFGRGSAAGSLVAWLLGITAIDPVEQGLWFERFLHPGRADPPDIDVDVDAARRDELLDWVRRRFGRERVARVSTLVTWRLRSALRSGLRAVGVAPARIDRIAARLPAAEVEPADVDRVALDVLPRDLHGHWPLLRRLIGMPRGIAAHPGGIVVAPGDLDAYVPLERAPGGTIVTQYDLRSIEHTGLLKIDLLGSHALTEIDRTITALHALPVDASPDMAALRDHGMDGIPNDDAATLAAIDRADTIGCFQIETPAVRSVLKRMPIRTLDDVTAALAVVRPGAASGRAKRSFLRRARGEEPARAPHADAEAGLRRSHGILLFEEDVNHLLATVGGLSRTEADTLRAAIVAAADDRRQLEQLGRRFTGGAAACGRTAREARVTWRHAVRFAAYSFSRAHAASYALLAFRAAYLRTHWPVQFGCALLDHHAGLYPRRTLAADLTRHGCSILPPSVLRSEVASSIEYRGERDRPRIRTGLGLIAHLRLARARAIVAERGERPFRSIFHAVERLGLNRTEVRALVLCGAFDDVPPLIGAAYPFAQESLLALLEGEITPETWQTRSRAAATGDTGELRMYRTLVRIRNELTFLDMHLTDHPLRVLRQEAARSGCITTLEAAAREGRVRVAVLIAASRQVRGRDGRIFRFLTLEDEHGLLEAIVPPGVHEAQAARLTTPGPYLVEGRIRIRQEEARLAVSSMLPFHERHDSRPGEV